MPSVTTVGTLLLIHQHRSLTSGVGTTNGRHVTLQVADNHVMHTKDRMARLQMETTLAVLGDDRRYPTEAGR